MLYIPPPPDDFPASPSSSRPPSQALSSTLAPASADYKRKRRRFVPFRPRAARPHSVSDADADLEGGPNADPWDQMWAAGPTPYPLVRLPENLATCGICLDGFQAPRRLNSSSSTQPPFSHADAFADELAPDGCAVEDEGAGTHEMCQIRRGHEEEAEVAEVQVESPVATDARAVELAHEGGEDAPGPLRLLNCGHAYHVRFLAFHGVSPELTSRPLRRRTAWILGLRTSTGAARTALRASLCPRLRRTRGGGGGALSEVPAITFLLSL